MVDVPQTNISLPSIVGKGYGTFWKDKHRYRVVKGGRGSKKSTTMALWAIYNIMKYPLANMLVVRKIYKDHKNSTFAMLEWATHRFQVRHLFKFNLSQYEITYLPTGQKILFRGFDDVLSLTSIAVPKGHLCWVWIEEAFQIESYDEFKTLDESIRGEMPEGLWKQITFTYNPWINTHWTKEMFFDPKNPHPDAYTLTTTHWCNEWMDEDDHRLIESLKKDDPERYKVVGLGEYGIPGGAYFNEFRRDIHVCDAFPIPTWWDRYVSIDYGLDMFSARFWAVSGDGTHYCYNEFDKSDMIVSEAANKLRELMSEDGVKKVYAPPDLWNRRNDTGKSAYTIFRENGVVLTKASNHRINGWLAVKEGLKVIDTVDEQTGLPRKTAKMMFFSHCLVSIDHIQVIKRDEKKYNDCAIQPHDVTHSNDAIRYYAVSRIKPSSEMVKSAKNAESFASQVYGRSEMPSFGELPVASIIGRL